MREKYNLVYSASVGSSTTHKQGEHTHLKVLRARIFKSVCQGPRPVFINGLTRAPSAAVQSGGRQVVCCRFRGHPVFGQNLGQIYCRFRESPLVRWTTSHRGQSTAHVSRGCRLEWVARLVRPECARVTGAHVSTRERSPRPCRKQLWRSACQER